MTAVLLLSTWLFAADEPHPASNPDAPLRDGLKPYLFSFPFSDHDADTIKAAGVEYFAFFVYDSSKDASTQQLFAEAIIAAKQFPHVAFVMADIEQDDSVYHALSGKRLKSKALLPKLIVSNHKTRKVWHAHSQRAHSA